MAATRPSIMSLGATMSAPAAASEACGLREERECGVVLDGVVVAGLASDDAAVAVRGVLAEADVGDEHERFCGGGLLEGAQAALHDAVVDPGAGAVLVFFGGKAEEQETADAECGAGFGFLHGFVDREVEDAGHGGDLAANAFAFAEEERVDERAGMQVRLAHERTHRRRGAEAAQACRGEVHGSSVVGGRAVVSG